METISSCVDHIRIPCKQTEDTDDGKLVFNYMMGLKQKSDEIIGISASFKNHNAFE